MKKIENHGLPIFVPNPWRQWIEPDTPADAALSEAVEKNDLDGVRRAFSEGASANATRIGAETPEGGQEEIVEEAPLLAFIDERTLQPSDRAAAIAIFHEFLERGADVRRVESNMGRSAIHFAASLGDESLVRAVVAHGAAVDALSPHVGSALSILLMRGLRDKEGPEVGAIQFLLEQGADPNTVNPFSGTTPLIQAAITNHPKTAALLLKHGADPNFPSQEPRGYHAVGWRSRMALEMAQRLKNEAVVRVLQEAKPKNEGSAR